MTRKRYIKLLMSLGEDRNTATAWADHARTLMSYADHWEACAPMLRAEYAGRRLAQAIADTAAAIVEKLMPAVQAMAAAIRAAIAENPDVLQELAAATDQNNRGGGGE